MAFTTTPHRRALRRRRRAPRPGLERFVPAVERLEPLTLLATVTWMNPAGGDWSVAANWSSGAVPAAAADVVIAEPANVTITHSNGASTVHSLTSANTLVVSGGSLDVIDGFTLGRGKSLTVQGASSTFAASGPTTIDGANLAALSGGTLGLSSAAGYAMDGGTSNSFSASGTGSRLDLSGLTGLAGGNGVSWPGAVSRLNVSATSGGTIDLSHIASLGGQTNVVASGTNSLIDLAALQATERSDAGILLEVDGAAQIHAPNLATLETTGLVATAGGVLDLPSVTTYDLGGGHSASLSATGAGSRVGLTGLTDLGGGNGNSWPGVVSRLTLSAASGGTVDLSNVVSLGGQTNVVASGAGSVVDLGSLRTTTRSDAGALLEVDGAAQIHAPNLATLETTNLVATAGGMLDLPSVTTYDLGGGHSASLSATGAGSRVGLTGLTTLIGGNGASWPGVTAILTVNAAAGGTVDVSNVVTIGGQTRVYANGPGSLVNLNALQTVARSDVGSLLEVDGAGAEIRAPGLARLETTNLAVTAGGVLDLPSVTTYDLGGGRSASITATGTGSRLNLGALPDLTGSNGFNWPGVTYWLTVSATGGGEIDLPAAATLGGQTQVTATGAGSLIDLSGLLATTRSATGTYLAASAGGQIALPLLASLDATGLQASGGSVLDLPAATRFVVGTPTTGTPAIQADGNGSAVNLPNLAEMVGTIASTGATPVNALNGGTVVLGTGPLTLTGRVQLSATAGSLSGGTLDLGPQALVTGVGTVRADVVNHGALQPGTTIGDLTIAGNYTQGADGTLAFLIGGPTGGSQFSRLNVTGSLTADGTLSATMVNGYNPAVGTAFPVLTFGSSQGDFSTLTVTALGGGNTLAKQFDATDMTLTVAAGPAPPPAPNAAVVSWDGGGGNSDWNNALNWSNDTLPGAASDVVVNVTGNTSITYAAAATHTTVHSLRSNANLIVNAGALAVGDGFFLSPDRTLSVNGAGAEFDAAGDTRIDQTNLTAAGGGVLSLPDALHYLSAANNHTVQATGAGSRLDLSGVTWISPARDQLSVVAGAGGTVDLSSAETSTGLVVVSASGAGSTVDLSALTFMNGGTLDIHDAATIALSSLNSLDSVNLTAFGGGALHLESVTRYNGPAGGYTLRASGAGSAILLPNVTTFGGGYGIPCPQCGTHFVHVLVDGGGHIDLTSVPKIDGTTNIVASDAGSAVTLTDLKALDGGSLEVHGAATIDVPALDSLNAVSLSAYDGGTLHLESVSQYRATSGTYTLRASGAGSELLLSHVTTFDGGYGIPCPQCGTYYANVLAEGGGHVDLSALPKITGRTFLVAHDAGSMIHLPNLEAMSGDGTIEIHGQAAIEVPALKALDGVNLSAYDGGTLHLESVSQYRATSGTYTLRASGAGSELLLSHVTTFDGGYGVPCSQCGTYYAHVLAEGGGQVDLAALPEITGRTFLDARDAGSTIHLPNLEAMSGDGSIEIHGPAAIDVPVLQSLNAVNLSAYDGGTLHLESVSQYQATSGVYTLRATGAGSEVLLPHVTMLDGGHGIPCPQCGIYFAQVTADSGGAVDLGSAGVVRVTGSVGLSANSGTITGGTLRVAQGADTYLQGTLTANLINEGLFRPALVPSLFTIDGDYTQASTGVLNLNIGGATAGTQFTQLAVTGHADLCGTLNVSMFNGFSPGAGSAFPLVTYASSDGDFLTVNATGLAAGSTFADTPGPADLTLTVVSNVRPTVSSLAANPTSLNQGDPLTLTANGAADANGSVQRVAFYWDADGNGAFDPCLDTLVTTDADGSDGWSATIPTASIPGGRRVFFAVALDNDDLKSSAAAATVVVNAALPPHASPGNAYHVREGGSVTLDASGSADPDGDALTYTWDINGDGTFGDATTVNPTLTWAQLQALGIDDGPSTFLVRVRVDDGHGDTATSGPVALAVDDQAPTAALSAPSSVTEGSAAVVALTNPSDPSSADTSAGFRYSFALSPGTLASDYASAGVSSTASFLFSDGPASATIYARVFDKDNGFSDYNAPITVTNAAPAVTLSGPASANEGATHHYSFTTSDPGTDTFSVLSITGGPDATISNQAFDATTGAGSFDVTFLDGPDMTSVSVQVADSDGAGSNVSRIDVAVANVAPTVTLSGPSSADEGATRHYAFTTSDPGADTFSVLNVTGGSVGTVSNLSFDSTTGAGSFDVTFHNGPATATVSVQVTDSDGTNSNVATIDVGVGNVAPTLTLAGPTSTNEGETRHYSFTSSDPGADTFSLASVTAGPDAAISNQVFDAATGAGSFDVTFRDGPNTCSVSVQVADSDCAASNVSHIDVAVANVPPSVAADQASVAADEGQTAANTGSWGDPGADVVTLGASIGTVSRNADGTWAWSFPTTDGPADSQSVTISATDSDGAVTTTSFALTVANVAPSVGAITAPAAPVVAAGTFQVSASFTDPGVHDTHTAVWDWGDGHTSTGVVTESGGSGSVGSSHAYAVSGTYTITLTVTDRDGGIGTTTLTRTVAPYVLVLDPTASAALKLAGNARIDVPGDVVVDSSAAAAVQAVGEATVASAGVRIVGGYSLGGDASLGGRVTTGAAPVADPLAGLSPPSAEPSQGAINLSGHDVLTIEPGVYSQIKVSGQAQLTMNPGVYVIAGGGLSISGNAVVQGVGVTIYNAGSSFPAPGGNFGGVGVGGNASVDLAAPTDGTYAGVLVFQARDNTRALALGGNAVLQLSGLVYAPSALLAVSGNSTLGVPLIVDQLVLSGNGSSNLAADAASAADVPSSVGQLLPGDVWVSVAGPFDADQGARIGDAVAGLNALLAPYSVTVTLLGAGDAGLANVVLDTGASTPAGGLADGVLGCETDGLLQSEITLVQGWDWYSGSDPAAILSGQYDFETAVLHELGHVLGLGHSADAASTMYALLAPGTAKRALSVADLAIPSAPDHGAEGLHAAPRAASSPTHRLDSPIAPTKSVAPGVVVPYAIGHAPVAAAPTAPRSPSARSAGPPVGRQPVARLSAERLNAGAIDSLLDDGTADRELFVGALRGAKRRRSTALGQSELSRHAL